MIGEPVATFTSGYQVFRACKLDEQNTNQSVLTKFGYKLIGPGGKEFYLMRTYGKSHLMIAMDMKKRVQPPEFKGVVFSDEDTELVIRTVG